MRIASHLIAWLSLAPGLAGQQHLPAALLTPADHDALGGKLQAWFDAHIALVNLENDPRKANNQRAKDDLRKKIEKNKRVFEDDMDKVAKTNKLAMGVLKNMADVKAIFAHAFSYKAVNGGLFTTRKLQMDKEQVDFGLWVPKSYDSGKNPYPLVLSLPGRTSDDQAWLKGKEHLETQWSGAPILEQVLLVGPAFPKDTVLDQPLGNDLKEDQKERARTGHVMAPLDRVMTECRVDTNRIVLECSRTNCLSALRIASYFPHMFAGIVVRDPADLASVPVDNFRHVPILFVVSVRSEVHANEFRARLAAAGIHHSRQHRSRDAFPFRADNAEIGQWILERVRDPFPLEVTLAPMSDRYKKAYWVTIDKCGPVARARPEERPRFEARIDRELNRFTITSHGVQQFSLLVNDALVDLDREISVFVNGQPVWKGKKARNLDDLASGVLRKADPNWLFVREITSLLVPPLAPAPAAPITISAQPPPKPQPAPEPPPHAPATQGPGVVLAVLAMVFGAALITVCFVLAARQARARGMTAGR